TSTITTLLLTHWTKLCRKNWQKIPPSSQWPRMRLPTWKGHCLVKCSHRPVAGPLSALCRPGRRPTGSWLPRLIFHSTPLQIAYLVEQKIQKSPTAIPHKSPWSSIDEISQQNTVARFHFWSDWVG